MAEKKTTKAATPAPAATAPATNATAADRAKAAEGDTFTYVKDLEKGAPQMKAIVNILKAAGASGLSRKDLVEKMNGVVTSRQPLSRILTYYTKPMIDAGSVTITKASGTPAPAPAA